MRTRPIVGVLALACVLASANSTLLFAQAGLHENHYKVYESLPIPFAKPLILSDQFGTFTVTDLVFDKFSTPAEKIHHGVLHPMIDPAIHMDWWRIFNPQPTRTIIGIDQFRQAPWTLGNAVYLLTPSLKNVAPPAPPVPTWNHYVCYEALIAPFVGEPVILIDQFGNAQVQVLHGKYFCNPAEKRADGLIYPIVDPIIHLACYQVENPATVTIPITTIDQFGFWQTHIMRNDCLCVPALKDHPVKTENSTWGKVKALYRN